MCDRRRPPCTAENGADLRLCTYNPEARPAGSAFLGSEIHTVKKWGGKGETVKFEARVKCPPMGRGGGNVQGGAVTSVFSYSLCRQGGVQNEIDFEFASNYWPHSIGKQEFLTNVFVCSSGAGSGPTYLSPPNLDLQLWHTFTLIYTPSRSVEWLVDGTSVRRETEHVPDWKTSAGMSLYMNFWAPNADWKWAYSESLKPTPTSPGETWHYYVKNAAVYYLT